MCLAQGPQPSDAGEARTRATSVSNRALYHWATALLDRQTGEVKIEPATPGLQGERFIHYTTAATLIDTVKN